MIVDVGGLVPRLQDSCYIADTAVVAGNVSIGEHTSVWFNTVIRGDINHITIGKNSNIQDNCTVHVSTKFPTSIGDYTVVGHNATIHACTIGKNVLVGIGAIILDGAIIGDHVIIGAGTLIPPGKVIESNAVVMGNPYKIIRSFNREDEEMIHGIISRYSKWSKIYNDTAKEVNR